MLAVFKYTSNQHAIKRVRNDINANLLALKLFKDSATVALRAQGRLLLAAGRLFVLAIVPMLVMALPVTLLLGQLALWYEARPLRVGEEAVITLKLGGEARRQPWPAVSLAPTDAVDVDGRAGPRAEQARGLLERQGPRSPAAIASCSRSATGPSPRNSRSATASCGSAPSGPAGTGSRSCSTPGKQPFRPDDPVQSIAIVYPERSSWTSGTF